MLDKAISLGRASKQVLLAQVQVKLAAQVQVKSSNTTSEPKPSSSNETRSSRSEVNMGLSSAGVAVQKKCQSCCL